jgi:hypothetical protein
LEGSVDAVNSVELFEKALKYAEWASNDDHYNDRRKLDAQIGNLFATLASVALEAENTRPQNVAWQRVLNS